MKRLLEVKNILRSEIRQPGLSKENYAAYKRVLVSLSNQIEHLRLIQDCFDNENMSKGHIELFNKASRGYDY